MMERLTKKTVGCFKYDLKDHEHKIGEFGTYEAFFNYSMAVKKLGEYEDAEEQREQKSMTNADHIRSMSDEELAGFMANEFAKISTERVRLDGVCISDTQFRSIKYDIKMQLRSWLAQSYRGKDFNE